MVTDETKQEFYTALKEECDFAGSQKEADEIIMEMVKYYRHLNVLNKKIESPHKPQN